MNDVGGRSVRFAAGFALVMVGFVQVYMLLLGLRTQQRLRDATVREVRLRVAAAAPDLQSDLRPGGPLAWETAARRAFDLSLAREVEVLAPDGRVLFSEPSRPPVAHRPAPREAAAIQAGEIVTTVARSGAAVRALTYVPLSAGGGPLLRLATPVPELERDLVERQHGYFAHLATLAVLVLAALLLFLVPLPVRGAAPAQALDAYEEAMGRLREHGQEITREHEVERLRMEGELHDKDAMARAGELTAGIVHEMRNGLGTILGYARLVERNQAHPEAAEAARSIREECETLEVVIRRFMQFVRQETLTVAPFDLERMLGRVVARESRGDGGRVTLSTASQAPPVHGDEELLERAFENLVRNAREAAGPQGQVSVVVAREEDTVTVAVEDDGPGLPADVDPLKPFVTTKAGGLGLGLPIARKIVRLHQGELVLERRTPRGARARVELPIGGADA